MCELLGISSSVRIRPGRYFAAFRKRGRELPEGKGNPDGWGIALYPDRKAVQLIKEAIPAATSRLCEFVSSYEHVPSRTFIAHVRKASRGILEPTETPTLFAEKSWAGSTLSSTTEQFASSESLCLAVSSR